MSVQLRTVVHPDIRPDNPPERTSHYIDAPNMPWESTTFPGICIKVLYSDDSGITTALFKLDPGAVVPLHEHVALEQTYVIEGTLGRIAPLAAAPNAAMKSRRRIRHLVSRIVGSLSQSGLHVWR
jgi:formate-dependent phosphoribosylglycinamide formyltransferase (GAR transformylase)